jgi:hypothetical protein
LVVIEIFDGILRGEKVGKRPKEEMTFEERVEKFQKYWNDPEQQYKIFSELGFIYVDDGCDGFCTACEQEDRCEVTRK